MANKMKFIAEKYHKFGRISYSVECVMPKIIPISIKAVAMIEHVQANGLNTFLMVFGFWLNNKYKELFIKIITEIRFSHDYTLSNNLYCTQFFMTE